MVGCSNKSTSYFPRVHFAVVEELENGSPMVNPAYIGPAVCSHTNGVLCTGTFTNLTIHANAVGSWKWHGVITPSKL